MGAQEPAARRDTAGLIGSKRHRVSPLLGVKGFRRSLAGAAAVLLSLSACAAEPKSANLSAVTYTYDEAYSDLKVNGKWAGAGSNSVKPGGVSGGGSICCVQIPVGAKEATVDVQTGVKDSYTVEARIEQPWTRYPHYAVVHLLPGRMVVIEITALEPAPRIDLLQLSLEAQGLSQFTIAAPHMWNSGPEESVR